MKSAIYKGTIRHRRFRPKPNRFRYKIFMMYMDLSELDTLFNMHPLWSHEKLNLAWFRRKDHFGDPAVSLDQAVRDLVLNKTGERPAGPIRMLTHLRYFGHCFNPATFYYCYNKNDTELETVVVEIHNTPWGEHHCYVLGKERDEHPSRLWRRHRFKKDFHVSPFIPMEIDYDWRFREPGETLAVHMIDYENSERLFDASLALKRQPVTRRALTGVLFQYPVMTMKVIMLIYWQAFCLMLKKTPFFTHPRKKKRLDERIYS